MFEKGIEEGRPRFWIKLDPAKLEKFSRKVDFYVFVLYETLHEADRTPHFQREYLALPTGKLIEMSRNKKGWAKGWLNYYFLLDPDERVIDVRDINRKTMDRAKRTWWRDYTKYRNAFDLIK